MKNQTHIMTRKMTFVKIFHQHLNLNHYDNEIKLLEQPNREIRLHFFQHFLQGKLRMN